MKIICPNLNNKKVKSQFNELVEATSENAAYHIWSHNDGNSIDRAPNGARSELFSDLLRHFNGDRRLAIQAKAKTFSKSFLEANNWLESGLEPSIEEVVKDAKKVEVAPDVRNKEMERLLGKLYPEIQVETHESLGDARGQAVIESNEAGRVLLSAAAEKADTLPHEYAHHYVAWFRNAEPIQKGIKLFGSEEAFVQAIGEQSIKALKWYNRFFSWFKGLLDGKQYYLAEVTNAFLNGKELGSRLNVAPELRFQLIPRMPKTETSKKIDNTYEKILRGLEARIGELSRYKVRDVKKEESLETLYRDMNNMENEKAIFQFIEYMSTDLYDAAIRMDAMTKKMNDAIINGTDYNVDNEVLSQIKAGFLGFYAPLIKNMQAILDDKDSFKWIPEQSERDFMRKSLKDHAGLIKNFADSWETLVSYNAKKQFRDFAIAHNSPSVDDLMEKLDHTDEDISMFARFTSSPVRIADEALRIMASKIQEIKNSVYRATVEKGKELTEMLEKVKLSDIQNMFERDEKGKKTGFLVRDLNYGRYLRDLNAFQTRLAEKYNLENIYMRPADKDQAREYNKEMNKWLSEHAERRYKPEYYELYNNLSTEAKFARDEVQMDIDYIYSKHMNPDGSISIEKFTDEEWNQIKALEKKKSNLGNLFYENGQPKTGLELEIAQEIKALNDELIKNVQYTTNIEKFKKEAGKMKAKLSDAAFKKWMDRNTVVKIRQSFWDLMNQLEKTAQTPEYEALNEKKKELLKRIRLENGEFDVLHASDELKQEIAEIDALLDAERTHAKKTPGGLKFDDFAMREVSLEYSRQLKQVRSLGDEVFQQWLERNTYVAADGTRKPASFWVTIKPKDRKKYMFVSPTARWSEVDKASNFFNQAFDETAGEAYVPKRNKYDNSTAYNKVMRNEKAKQMYDKVLSTMEEANNKLHFQKRPNKFKLPQIEGGLMNTLKEQDGIFNKVKTLVKDAVNVKPDDDRYNINKAIRPDGSPIEMVPTRYMKMLENPALLTDDLVGSVIKYFEMADNFQKMNGIKSDLEIMSEQIGLREFKHTTGKESQAYKKSQDILEMHLYGRNRKNVDVKIPFTNVTISASKIAYGLADLTRILGISQNINVILTGFITNIIHTRLDAFSGVYWNHKDLANADITMSKEYHKAMLGIGKPTYKTKTLGLLEYNSVSTSLDNMFGNLQSNRFARVIKEHFWYGGHAMGDFATKGRMALAVYFNHKLFNDEFLSNREFMRKYYPNDPERGKVVWKALKTSLYDTYDMKDGLITVKPEYKHIITTRLEDKIKNTISTVATRIDGQLSDMDKAAIHAGYLTQFLTIFRNFMLQMYQNKLGNMVYNYNTEMIEGGEWTMAINFLRDKYFGTGPMATLREQTQTYEEAKDYAKRVMKRCSLELGVAWIALPLLMVTLTKASDEDDDDWGKAEASYLATRATLEIGAANNPLAFMELIKSPTAATSVYDSFMELFNTITSDPTKEIKRGPYKGYNRLEKSLIKLTPLKLYIEAQDPRAKQQYLQNQIMK